MNKVKKMLREIGLVVREDKGKFVGNSCNNLAWPIYRLWINKGNKLTVKTRGVQKSFENWENKEDFEKILRGFEII